MKKILALALAIMMIMALAIPAAAYDITINESMPGHTYEAYQIFGGEISGGVLTNITWGDDIDGEGFLAALLADTTEISNADGSITITFQEAFGVNADYTTACATAEDVATRIKAWTDNGDRMQHFARLAAEYVTTPSATTTDADGYKLAGLEAGYYLIKDAAYDNDAAPLPEDFYTDIILSVVTNATVEVKGDIPTLKKEISLDPVTGFEKGVAQEIGKVVYYKLTASLPSEYDEYDEYYMEFVDTMSKGLTYAGIQSITVNYRDTGATDLVVPAAQYPTPTVTPGTNTVIKIAWNDIKATFPEMTVGDHLEVVLKATVNADAVIGHPGNPNDAQLIYSNDPNGTGKGITKEDHAIAYTFDMDVIKTIKGGEGETTTTLANAKFVLLHKHGSNEVFAVIENGKLVKWVAHHEKDNCPAGTHTTETELATILTSVAGETMAVDGLTEGLQYYLREVEAPQGYNKLFSDIPLKLDATIDAAGNLTDFSYEANNVTVNPAEAEGSTVVNTSVLVEVENSAGTKLPSTGGMGTTVFYTLGSVLVLGALVMLITKKRMTAE